MMTVILPAIGALALWYLEHDPVGSAPSRSLLLNVAAAWVLISLPMLIFLLWSAKRLRAEWARAEDRQEHATAAEDNYQQLVEQASDIIYRVDLNGYFTYINPTVTRYKGYTQEELIGQHFTDHIRPDARAAARRHYMRQFASRTPTTYYEFPVIKKDGDEIWLGQNVQLLIENDRVVGFQAVARDITERQRAQEALRTTTEFLQAVVQTSPLAIITLDARSNVVSWNRGAEELLGWSESEVLGKPLPYIPADKEAESDRLWNEAQEGSGLNGVEILRLRKDGTPVDLVLWSRTFRDAQGRPVSSVGILADITERKQAEEDLKESEKRFRAIFDQAPLGIAVIDSASGQFIRINGKYCDIVGYSQKDMLACTFQDITHPDDLQPDLDNMRQLMEGRIRTFKMEKRYFRKDGSLVWVNLTCVPLWREYETEHRYHLAMVEDITERKQAEEALEESRQRLHESETRYRNLYEHNPLMYFTVAADGTVLSVNPQGAHQLGYTVEALTGRPVTTVFPADLHASVHAQLDTCLKQSTRIHTWEITKVRKDGTVLWVRETAVTVEDPARPPVILIMCEDITERKLAEQRLEKINACFLDYVISPEANINRLTGLCGELLGAACALYNYLDGPQLHSIGQWNTPPDYTPVSPAIGHVCYDVIRQDATQPMTVRHLQHTSYAQTDPHVVPYKLQTYVGLAVKRQGIAVGSLCAVFQRDFVPSEDDARLMGTIAAAIGVEEERRFALTEQKRLLSELAESRNRFEMFFRQTPSAISITTMKEGRFLDLNEQAEILTGFSRDELIGRTTVEMNLYVDPSDRPGLVEALRQKGILTDVEREIRTKSGQIRTAVFSLVPIMMGSEPCLLSIAHDITERKQAERRLHEQSRQQAIEAELSVLAVTIQDLPDLLSTAAGLVSNALEVNYCEVLELLQNGADLRLCASAGWRGDEVGRVRALETGSPAHAALSANKPVVRTLLKESRFGGPQWLHEHGPVTGVSVSIPGKDGPWGVMGVYTTAARPFSRDDVNFLQTVSSILGAAIERMQTEGVLRSANQSLRLLSRKLLQVQEEDRRAIARDLHDEIGQSLTAIKLNVERAQRTVDRDTRARIMQDCAEITESVLAQVRNLSLDLHPSILDDLGLAYALKWYADRQAERAGLKVELTADPSMPRLPPEVEIACFRIAQEALTNVVRHARANQAGVTLNRDTIGVVLIIKDDGIGFAEDRATAPLNTGSSVGLASMQERAKLLGGTVTITSAPGCGTTVVARLPLSVTSPAATPAEKTRQP